MIRFMKRTALAVSAAALMAGLAQAQEPKICQKITGTVTESILPQSIAPNDPFGRVAGSFEGNFGGAAKAAKTAILITPPQFTTSNVFSRPLAISVRETFITGPGDTISVSGTSYFTLAPGTLAGDTASTPSQCPGTPCVITVPKVTTITGGTGRWAGATGQIREIGLGNLNLPQGQGTFVSIMDGEVCLPAGSVSAFSQKDQR